MLIFLLIPIENIEIFIILFADHLSKVFVQYSVERERRNYYQNTILSGIFFSGGMLAINQALIIS